MVINIFKGSQLVVALTVNLGLFSQKSHYHCLRKNKKYNFLNFCKDKSNKEDPKKPCGLFEEIKTTFTDNVDGATFHLTTSESCTYGLSSFTDKAGTSCLQFRVGRLI